MKRLNFKPDYQKKIRSKNYMTVICQNLGISFETLKRQLKKPDNIFTRPVNLMYLKNLFEVENAMDMLEEVK